MKSSPVLISPAPGVTLAEQLFYDIQNAPDPAKLRALQNLISTVADESVSANELQDEVVRRWCKFNHVASLGKGRWD